MSWAEKALPSFFILGAQKAGTSSLFKYIAAHPSIDAPVDKEINFFTHDQLYSHGQNWYSQQFLVKRSLKGPHITFEATPEYLYYPFISERIFKMIPNPRFIVMLRNPVDRAFSAWNMYRKLHAGTEKDWLLSRIEICNQNVQDGLNWLLGQERFPSFEACIDYELERIEKNPESLEPSFIRRGFYDVQIENYFRFFDDSKFFFALDSELKGDRPELLNRITSFLNLSAFDFSTKSDSPKNVGQYTNGLDSKTHNRLEHLYDPHNFKLKQLIKRDIPW